MTENRTSVQTNGKTGIPDSGLKTHDSPPRRRGGQKGNCNAVRHGLYSRKNFEANMVWLKDNTDLGRADREIFLAVWQIAEAVHRDPSNESLRASAVARFYKLVMRKFGIKDYSDTGAVDFALSQVERDIRFPPERFAEIVRHLV
jgi:hypothetical protein